jgi:hypothetical protein
MARTPWSAPSFEELVELERDPGTEPTIRHRRSGSISKASSDGAAVTWLEHPDDDFVGIALSGGGIRSATFNLGLLQALSELGLTRAFDYVATVSGGGYIGGFWSGWRARRERAAGSARESGIGTRESEGRGAASGSAALPTDARARDPFSEPPREGRAESDSVRHLREFSNFLNPRLGLLTYDTGRLIATVFSSTLPSILAAISVLVLVVGAWRMLAYGIIGLPVLSPNGAWESLAVLIALTAAVFITEERKWIHRGERWSWWYLPAVITGLIALAWLWLGLFLHINEHLTTALALGTSIANNALLLMLPSAAWLSAAVVMVAVRLFVARAGVPALRAARVALDRITVRLIALAAGWVALSGLYLAAAVVLELVLGSSGAGLTGFAGLTAAVGAAFGLLQRFLSQAGAKPLGGRIASMLKPKMPQLLAYAAVIGMMLTVVMGLLWFDMTPMFEGETWLVPLEFGPVTIDRPAIPYALALLITVVTVAVFNPNEVGLHGFYRSRLARAYLGASSPEGRRQTEERRSDDLRLDWLSRHRPMHLICCAANDLSPSSDHLGNLHRGATSAVLSPVGFSVGSEWAAWPPDDAHIPTLASAMTASGAAFNSHMGSKSMELGPAVTFLMAALNLRLGLWLPHPAKFAHRRYRLFPGMSFYYELMGQSRANGAHVHLSDGGHFENMALYELVRRHCRYIIASDCGADADVAFDDLGNAIRRVREDFGVEIDIDLTPLRPNDHGCARQAMVAGDVRYPNGDTGVLLVFKPTLTGNEPADIAQYQRRNSAFPHESTGDQFYDEAQWESYRRLGAHCATTAFRRIVAELPAPPRHHAEDADADAAEQHRTRLWAARVFARARMRWQPVPPGLEQRLTGIVDRAVELDALLQQPECGPVLREVYKEVDELDRLARQRMQSGDQTSGTTRPSATAAGPLVRPRPEELAPSLHAIRRAILFMEEVYLSEDLERQASHPLYLGITNYFARWAYAPLFRMWWPLLKSMYAHEFTGFLERRFQLAAVGAGGDQDERVLTAINAEHEGFAMHCWRLHGLPLPVAARHERLLSFALAMRYHGQTAYHVQAAQLLVRQTDGIAAWDADHFFVPPGLWGIGIGGRFLSRLVVPDADSIADGGPLFGVQRLLVRISAPRHTSRTAAKEVADLAQLYRDAGFRETRARRIDAREVRFDDWEAPPVQVVFEQTAGREREWWFVRNVDVT